MQQVFSKVQEVVLQVLADWSATSFFMVRCWREIICNQQGINRLRKKAKFGVYDEKYSSGPKGPVDFTAVTARLKSYSVTNHRLSEIAKPNAGRLRWLSTAVSRIIEVLRVKY
jgi:hypothetical protein